jgi:hypothetical protein
MNWEKWTISTNLAQRSKDAQRRATDARRRCLTRFVHAVRQHRRAQQRLFEIEHRMERAADAYQRTILAGAQLPPMLSNVLVTAPTVGWDRSA